MLTYNTFLDTANNDRNFLCMKGRNWPVVKQIVSTPVTARMVIRIFLPYAAGIYGFYSPITHFDLSCCKPTRIHFKCISCCTDRAVWNKCFRHHFSKIDDLSHFIQEGDTQRNNGIFHPHAMNTGSWKNKKHTVIFRQLTSMHQPNHAS